MDNDLYQDLSSGEPGMDHDESVRYPDVSQIQPYSFEPVMILNTPEIPVQPAVVRSGHINWCQCGHCVAIETEVESVCCKEDVPGELFDESCITLSENFASVCLHQEVLRATLASLNNLKGDRMVVENKSFRYAAYRLFTWWIHNRLGQGVRKVIPSCAVWAIRNQYPEPNGVYVPFQEAVDEMLAIIP